MTFPGYEVLARVAEGSTGVVWQARQVELDRVVAIKELSPALLGAPGFLQRFRAEAQTLAVLDDPHVVRVYDYVEEPARAYLVQEWVEGAPLAAVLAQHGALSPEQSLGVLRGGLMGLAHAHQRGLVHRDVSPANILLDRGGVSKLVDFGLAARTEEGIAPGAATSLGTPAFTSPEAVIGAPMTTRSDVYSAAAVLYLLLSGRLPYSGDAAQVLAAHTSAPVPRLDGHGPELAGLLSRAMAKDPAQRPPDAAAFLAELEQAATRRYGAGWLDRSSVAGLVTATAATATTAALTAGSTGASAAPPAAAQALAYGNVAGTAARTGAHILGMPVAAAITALVVVVAAFAATLIIVTSNTTPSSTVAGQGGSDGQQGESAAEGGPGETDSGSADSGTPAPAFDGTYGVTITLTGYSGSVHQTQPVGTVVTETWQVSAACESGPCDVAVSSNHGDFELSYSGGSWTSEGSVSTPCVGDDGVPSGDSGQLTILTVIKAAGATESASTTPLAALSGTIVQTSDTSCNGLTGSSTQTVELSRTG